MGWDATRVRWNGENGLFRRQTRAPSARAMSINDLSPRTGSPYRARDFRARGASWPDFDQRPPGTYRAAAGLGPTSEMGRSQPNWAFCAMSGLPALATELRTSLLVRFVPKAEALDWTIILPFSQLGGLHGAQWSRSPDLKRIMEDQVTTAEFAKRRCDAHGR